MTLAYTLSPPPSKPSLALQLEADLGSESARVTELTGALSRAQAEFRAANQVRACVGAGGRKGAACRRLPHTLPGPRGLGRGQEPCDVCGRGTLPGVGPMSFPPPLHASPACACPIRTHACAEG